MNERDTATTSNGTNGGGGQTDGLGAILTETAKPIADRAKEAVEEGKNAGARQLQNVAKAVHSAADEIGKDMPQAAGLVHRVAGNVERAASQLGERRIDDYFAMACDFARRHPVAFVGISVFAGFLLSRALAGGWSSDRPPGASEGSV